MHPPGQCVTMSAPATFRPATMDNSLYVVHQIRSGSNTPNILPPHPQGLELQRVWTLIDEDLLREVGPVHNSSAFLEDCIHDWRLNDKGEFFYYSRVAGVGVDVQVVLDYETSAQRDERRRASRANFDPMTGARVAGK